MGRHFVEVGLKLGWVGLGRFGSVGSAGATCATAADNRFATRGLDDARMLDRAV